MQLVGVGTRPVVHGAIAKRGLASGLHLDVDLGSVVEVDEQVQLDSLVAHVLFGNSGVEDGDLGDGARGLDHGGEQGDEDLLALGSAEQEFEDDVEGGVEGVHGLRKSKPQARTGLAKSKGNLAVRGWRVATLWTGNWAGTGGISRGIGRSGGRQGEGGGRQGPVTGQGW